MSRPRGQICRTLGLRCENHGRVWPDRSAQTERAPERCDKFCALSGVLIGRAIPKACRFGVHRVRKNGIERELHIRRTECTAFLESHPRRGSKTNVSESGASHRSARSRTGFTRASWPSRLSKIKPSRCSDSASVPIPGSRFVGDDSIKKFTVAPSPAFGQCEHPAAAMRREASAAQVPGRERADRCGGVSP
jgi:hypothetical protein